MAQRTCPAPGCEDRARRAGCCSKHYQRWRDMIDRCEKPGHPAYKWYGARGITVHESWHDMVTFYRWITENLGACPPGHSLDRVDNDRGYEPGNVRWATHSEQMANRRPGSEWRRALERDFTCIMCGATFKARKSNAVYCTKRCRNRARRKTVIETSDSESN